MKPNDFAKCKRRIAIENIVSVTVSQASDEFVVHVPDEYVCEISTFVCAFLH